MTLAVLGAGAFGTALAAVWGAARPVTLWGRAAAGRESPRLPGVHLPDRVTVTRDLPKAETLVLALPMPALPGFLADHGAALDGRRLVAACKGVDLATGLGPAGLVARACPKARVAVLTGPSFAADIAAGLPTALTLACADEAASEGLQQALSTPTLRLYRTTDVTGAELGGALKNVIAIAAGVVIGAGLGDSARAAVVTRGFAEMTRAAVVLGARAETLAGLSGLGDLVLTCTSPQSRNLRFGMALGRGEGFDPAVTVEGRATAPAMERLAVARGLDLPLTAAVAALCDGRLTLDRAIAGLMSRPLRAE
ncbi:MAG TPA: NAD(P)H-dependent glycerol-3-phosphate dehydrogenase [Paracoccaceae bacterium]|nr:NAD(P)H-dependent glycerol-3-phosphate dehydrogenase [Paracoccaceae bacterium]HMO73655.1 NAD(P)H-dependent glycerol-3-phosphate dehydrogenase [Paracoccaceae bacterium]